jgi:hypothetical protein
MISEVNAVIRGLGKPYSDGTEPIEIHVPTKHANGLPYSYDTRVPVVLYINGKSYHAGLRVTKDSGYVWICPDAKAEDGTQIRLSNIVAEAGFKKNDRVSLQVDGKNIRIESNNLQRNTIIKPQAMIDIPDVMEALFAQRKVFHSEADFQHAFAWEVHRRFPDSSVRLERPLSAKGKTLHLDFLIQLPERAIAIELKYKTKKLMFELDGEDYHLANHGAQDCGRYDFIKDICRLEHITSSIENCEGYAILLTNDSLYWKPSSSKGIRVDAAFHLSEGRVLHGSLGWTENASDGTKKNRESHLQVDGEYPLSWSDYAITGTENSCQFRYLVVYVPKCA